MFAMESTMEGVDGDLWMPPIHSQARKLWQHICKKTLWALQHEIQPHVFEPELDPEYQSEQHVEPS